MLSRRTTLVLALFTWSCTARNPHTGDDPIAAGGLGCGNGVVDPGEACDDGNVSWCDGCAGDCASVEPEQVFWRDADGDGYGARGSDPIRSVCVPASVTVADNDGDCDDDHAGVNPGEAEQCGTAWDEDCAGDAELDCGGDILTFTFNSGSATDSSGNGNDGTPQYNSGCGGPGTPYPVAAGRYGQGMYFPGRCAWIEVPDSDHLFAGNEVTVEAWMLRETATYGHIYGDMSGGTPETELTVRIETDGDLTVLSNDDPARIQATSSMTTVEPNVWTHLAVTWDGSTVSYYIDAELSDTRSMSGTVAPASSQYRIGSLAGSWGYQGIIDELRVTSYAKSVEEIAASMARDTTQ